MIKDIIKSFLPWILFTILSGKSQYQLDTAIVVAFIASVIIGFPGIKKGFILSWGTLVFFTFLFIPVVLLKIDWIAKHAWIFSNGALALIAWFSVLIGKPFTIQYAKEQVSSDKWHHPVFIKINYILTIVWGLCFLIATLINVLLVYYPTFPEWIYQALTNGLTVFAIWFTAWFPKYSQNKAQEKKNPQVQ